MLLSILGSLNLTSVKTLTDGVTQLYRENKKIKETILDIQARRMWDNPVFSGTPEQAEEDAESTVPKYFQAQLDSRVNRVLEFALSVLLPPDGVHPEAPESGDE
ncbi:hypothetical protein XENORESO_015233, partial [Xenotaenia resolanae]